MVTHAWEKKKKVVILEGQMSKTLEDLRAWRQKKKMERLQEKLGPNRSSQKNFQMDKKNQGDRPLEGGLAGAVPKKVVLGSK